MAKSFTIASKEALPPIDFEVVLPPLPVEPKPKVVTTRTRGARTAKAPVAAEEPEPQLRVETFKARATMPAYVMIEVEGMIGVPGSEQARRYVAFFERAIVSGDWLRFHDMLTDPVNEITNKELGEMYRWLYEVYSERPTQSV